MKNLFTLLTLLFITNSTFSQNPTLDFEEWYTPDATNYEDPVGWASLNFLNQFGVPLFVKKDTNSYKGNYALSVETVKFMGDTVTGLIQSGSIDFNGFQANIRDGYIFTARPKAMTGYYKYFPGSGTTDTFRISFTVFKYDTLSQSRVVIGTGIFSESKKQPEFSQFTLDIEYDTTLVPDSALIFMISSGTTKPVPGSRLVVDNLSFQWATSVPDEVGDITKINIFPNPSPDGNINIKAAGGNQLLLYSSTGKLLLNKAIGKDLEKVTLPEGKFFLYKVVNDEGEIIKNGKIIKP